MVELYLYQTPNGSFLQWSSSSASANNRNGNCFRKWNPFLPSHKKDSGVCHTLHSSDIRLCPRFGPNSCISIFSAAFNYLKIINTCYFHIIFSGNYFRDQETVTVITELYASAILINSPSLRDISNTRFKSWYKIPIQKRWEFSSLSMFKWISFLGLQRWSVVRLALIIPSGKERENQTSTTRIWWWMTLRMNPSVVTALSLGL